MKKNVASQIIGAQMVSATDGSAFTGSVTVYVTGNGGTQAVGSVGSGACTHEGNGFHTYAPAQAETNYDHVAFTFIGTGAVPATVQVYPTFPQTGDAFDRLGAPAGASVSADVAAVKVQTAAIETDTQDIQSRIPAALVSGRIDASVGAMASNVMTAAAAAADLTTELQSGLATASALSTVDANVSAIKAKTDNLPASPAAVSDIPTAAAIADQVWDEILSGHSGVGSTGAALSAAGGSGDPWATALPGAYGAGTAGQIVGDYLDTAVSGVGGLDAAGVRAAVGLASANLDTQLDALPTAVENADALLGRNVSGGSSTGRTVKQALHILRNKSGVAAGTLTVYDTDDSTSSWTAAVSSDAAADPITGIDPA